MPTDPPPGQPIVPADLATQDCREQVESTVTSYGRWLLSAVFDNDAAAALAPGEEVGGRDPGAVQ